MTLPKLWRRKRDGEDFGAWHVYIRNKPINLRTDDREIASERRKEAVRGKREWPRRFAAKVRATPATEGTARAVDAIAALGERLPEETPPLADAHAEPTGAGAAPSAGGAPAPEVIEPERIETPPVGNWTADVASAAAAEDHGAAEQEAPRLRLADLPWFPQLLVTLSKCAVGLQVALQAWMMRLVGDVEAGRVGPPPALKEPDGAQSLGEFVKAAGAPWDANDPREPGRLAYAGTIMALIPEELPVPLWIKWLDAPVITAMNTAPVQWKTGKKIKRDADGNVVPEPEAPPAQPEAPPGERAAA